MVRNFLGMSVSANYFMGVEAVGGKIWFYETFFMFKPHSFNFQTKETVIYYAQINNVTKRNTLGLVPNGMSVFTFDGKEHKFVLWDRSEIIDFLNFKAAELRAPYRTPNI